MTDEEKRQRANELIAKPILYGDEIRELFLLCEPETEFDREFTHALLNTPRELSQ